MHTALTLHIYSITEYKILRTNKGDVEVALPCLSQKFFLAALPLDACRLSTRHPCVSHYDRPNLVEPC